VLTLFSDSRRTTTGHEFVSAIANSNLTVGQGLPSPAASFFRDLRAAELKHLLTLRPFQVFRCGVAGLSVAQVHVT
jgi:hypothetical protein